MIRQFLYIRLEAGSSQLLELACWSLQTLEACSHRLFSRIAHCTGKFKNELLVNPITISEKSTVKAASKTHAIGIISHSPDD